MAIDGDLATYSLAAVAGGSSEIGWWQVDLGRTFKINSVLLYNSFDYYGTMNVIEVNNE